MLGPPTPYWPAIPPTSTQHDNLVHNLRSYIEIQYKNTLISNAANTMPNVQKWLTNENIHPKWSNLLWDAPQITNTQLTQTLKFRCGRYHRDYYRKHVLKQDMSLLCNLCPFEQNDNYLHLLSYFTNKHINNLCTSRHNNTINAIANTLVVWNNLSQDVSHS